MLSNSFFKYMKAYSRPIIWFFILLFINIIAFYFPFKFDLTEENRFTLSKPTVQKLKTIDDVVHVKILLAGDFPSGFKRLQQNTIEILDEFRSINWNIEYDLEDPLIGNVDQINNTIKSLSEVGINPVDLKIKNADGNSSKLIYPHAVITYRQKSYAINLLENQTPGANEQIVLNNSVSLLEYKFIDAINKITQDIKPNILFLDNKDGLTRLQTADLRKTLLSTYNVGHINLDSVIQIKPEVDVLIIAKPRKSFSNRDKFLIDQYVMNGGKTLWLIDRMNVTLDSMRATNSFIPFDYPLNIEDQLFKYGVRIQPNLVLDMNSTRIQLSMGKMGNAAKFELFPWPYHPLVVPANEHPITKSIDPVELQFPSRIDTVKTATNIEKTILLTSSPYSREQFSPVRLNFEFLRTDLKPDKFNQGPKPVAVLLEGKFPSLYNNRVSTDFKNMLDSLNQQFIPIGKPTKMVVVSDGDIAKNLVNQKTQKTSPLGYNKFEKYIFANKSFLINSIEYLLDDNNLLSARSKEVKLRLIDQVKAQEEKSYWQAINLIIPVIIVLVFGLLFSIIRKRKYAN